MKKQKLILPIAILFTVMTLVLVSAAAAENNMSSPIDGVNYTSTITVTVNYDGHNSHNMSNVTCYYGITSATTWLLEIENTTAYQRLFTGSATISAIADGLLYNITCYMRNASIGEDGSTYNKTFTVTKVGIDNRAPTIDISVDYSEITLHRILKYSTAMSDATSGLDGTEVCNITDPRGTVYSVSTSADDAFFDETAITGTYTLSCSAADRTAVNGNSTSVTFDVKTSGPLVKYEEKAVTKIPFIGEIFDIIKNIFSGIGRAIENILSGFKK